MESALRQGGRDPGLCLIETLGWDGTTLIRADLHLARLARSAAILGWPCDIAVARAALLAGRDGPARLRLTLDQTGRTEVTVAPLVPVTGPWRIGLASTTLQSDDPWLTIKSTRRAAYDTARANLPTGIDEVIFLNERAEVCDGSITTVFFDTGSGLCTPPLSSGLLPGVLRESLLAGGTVRQAVLHGTDLAVARLWVGNSLRGLISAVWTG